mmetsp:Transcript_10073/g.20997  ORF Transcript_10073/g.20997 Transcript_10073/m.20997 type:complete len:244 (-) Transcript_10073:667-1398(-)
MMLKLQTSISNQPFKCCLHLLRRRIRNSSSSTTIDDPSIFIRYAFSVQYHGGNSLGFSYQGPKAENCIVYHPSSLSDRAEDADATHNEDIILSAPKQQTIQADLRGLESIEGRIRRALDHLVGRDGYQNIRVSSRTDRGVHAWRNTFHVDIRASVIGKKILQLPVLESLDGDECETISSSSSSSSTFTPTFSVNLLDLSLSSFFRSYFGISFCTIPITRGTVGLELNTWRNLCSSNSTPYSCN